jgi:colicin import membrane protein
VKISRFQPSLILSAAVHAGLLLAALFLFSDARKFEDAQEAVAVEVLSDSQFHQVMKGEKSARDIKVAPRVDRVADAAETKPHPPLAEAKKDVPTPPPSLKRLPDPGEDDKPELPTPPKRAAALPAPAPAPTSPAKPMAAAAPRPEKDEPDEAEIVKPKPPARPKPEKEAKETPKETPTPPKPAPPEKPKPEPRLKVDEVAKLLREKSRDEKAEDAQGETADKSEKASKPKSGDETAQKSKFDAVSISNLLSREAPQRRAATGREMTRTASLGAPTASDTKLSPSLQGRIDSYTVEHYRRCWAAALSMNAITYTPRVEFRLTREGALEGAPRLLNPSSNPVERSRGEQALASVRRCSPMSIPSEFAPYYDYWRVTELDMKEDM